MLVGSPSRDGFLCGFFGFPFVVQEGMTLPFRKKTRKKIEGDSEISQKQEIEKKMQMKCPE